MKIDFDKEEEAARLRGSLYAFTQFFIKYMTQRDYIASRPIGRESHQITICRELTKIQRLEYNNENLLINVQPGSGKTLHLCMFVAWCFTHNADCNFIYVSYSQTLAAAQTAFIKQIMQSEMYRYLFDVHIARDSRAKDHFSTTANGHVAAFGSSGAITGRNAGLPGLNRFSGAVIVDDAHKPDEAHSDTIRKGVIQNYEETLRQRPRGPNVPIIYIGQRVHEDDLAAFLLGANDTKRWRSVILKSIDEAGNALYPEVHSIDYLRELEEKSPYVYSSQFQQEPIPAGGGIFNPDWIVQLDFYPKIVKTFITADSAETEKSYNDATVFSFWGVYEIETMGRKTGINGLHWIDCIEIRIEPKDLKDAFLDFWGECNRFEIPPQIAAIEKKSTGVTLVSALEEVRGMSIKPINRTTASGSKTERFLRSQPYVASKQISINKDAKHKDLVLDHISKITANQSHRNDDVCHLAGSKIATINGDVNVENIKVGHKVITPLGIGTVTDCGTTGHHEVIHKFGLKSTPNHKVLHGDKFISLMKATDMIMLHKLSLKELFKWKQRQLLCSMEKNLDCRHRQDILRLLKENIEINFFTVLFGNFIQKRKYQKALLFTIKTIINWITVLKIWSAYHTSNIVRFILKGKNLMSIAKKSWKKCGKTPEKHNQHPILKNTNQFSAKSGFLRKIQRTVLNAAKNLTGKRIAKKHALYLAENQCKTDGIEKGTGSNPNLKQTASTAESHSVRVTRFQKNTAEKHAHISAQESGGIKEVFNLKVEPFGVYYANGILVSNCDTMSDAIDIALIEKQITAVDNSTKKDDDKMSTLRAGMLKRANARRR